MGNVSRKGVGKTLKVVGKALELELVAEAAYPVAAVGLERPERSGGVSMTEIGIGIGCLCCGIVFALSTDFLVVEMNSDHFDVLYLDLMMRSSTDLYLRSCPGFYCCRSRCIFSFCEDSGSCRYYLHVP